MAQNLTDNWQIDKILTDNWRLPPPIQTLHKGQKIHNSSRTFQSKIHPNGSELALEENQNPAVFERLEYIARSIRASHKPIRKRQSQVR